MKRLTKASVEAATRPGRYFDGDAGLFLLVQVRNGNTTKSYKQRLSIHGKRVELGLGSVKWTSPSEARALAQANRKIARMGGDPREGRRAVPSFQDGVDAVIAIHRDGWKDGAKSEKQWRSSLATHAYPRLGKKPVSAITAADVLATLVPIWQTKRETARRVKQRIGAVMDWAIAGGASRRQSRARHPGGAAVQWDAQGAPSGAPVRRRGGRSAGRGGLGRVVGYQVRLCAAGAHGGALGRSPGYAVGRSRRRNVDHPRGAGDATNGVKLH